MLGVENFSKSEEAFAADALFLAYQSGQAATIQAAVQVHGTFVAQARLFQGSVRGPHQRSGMAELSQLHATIQDVLNVTSAV